VPSDALESAPNLNVLFRLCDGRPNLLTILVKAILLRSKQNPHFRQSLPNIPLNLAEDVFMDTVADATTTYGFHRWHGLFGGNIREDAGDVSHRASFHGMTYLIMKND
jgi:hypothetical protein